MWQQQLRRRGKGLSMAKVFIKFVGGERLEKEASTVAEAKSLVGAGNHTAMVNGTTADGGQKLKDGDFVVLSKQVKGNAEIIIKLKNMVITKEGSSFFVNGDRLTKGQAEKVAKAIFISLGYEVE